MAFQSGNATRSSAEGGIITKLRNAAFTGLRFTTSSAPALQSDYAATNAALTTSPGQCRLGIRKHPSPLPSPD